MSGISAQRSSTAGANKSLSNLVDVDINEPLIFNPGSDTDMDLIRINVTGAPKLWWDEATDSLRMNKSLALPGNSLKLGTHVLSEETAENDDGFAVVGSIHVDKYPGGRAGNLCMHEGTEPIAGAEGDMHRIWVDNNHDIQWQNHLGVSSIIHIAGGAHDVPEIYNTLGDLKIQPDVQGNVELFGDTDVGDAENGKMLYVRRQAAEGNNYLRFYITSARTAMIHGNADLTLQGQTSFTINSVDDNIFFKVGDSAGAKKVYFRDKAGMDVSIIDSNGNAWFRGDVTIGVSSDVLIQANGLSYFNGGNFGIGTDDPEYILSLLSTAPVIKLENSRTIMGMGYNVGTLLFNAGELSHNDVAEIRVNATEDWTDISSPTRMAFYTTPIGSIQSREGIRLDESGDVIFSYNIDISGNIIVGGTVDGIDIATDVAANTTHRSSDGSDHSKVTANETAIALKAPLASPTFTGIIILPGGIWGSNGFIGVGTDEPEEILHLAHTAPTIVFEETDEGTDEKFWELHVKTEGFSLQTESDDHGSSQTVWIAKNRTGINVAEFVIPNAQVGIGTSTLSGKLTVDQPSTGGAIPVLTLDQADVSEPFIEFLGGAVSTGKNGQNEYLKVKVGGSTRYLRLFN